MTAADTDLLEREAGQDAKSPAGHGETDQDSSQPHLPGPGNAGDPEPEGATASVLPVVTFTKTAQGGWLALGFVWLLGVNPRQVAEEARSKAKIQAADIGGWVRWSATKSQYALGLASETDTKIRRAQIGAALVVERIVNPAGAQSLIGILPIDEQEAVWLVEIIDGEIRSSGDLVSSNTDAAVAYLKRRVDERPWSIVIAPAGIAAVPASSVLMDPVDAWRKISEKGRNHPIRRFSKPAAPSPGSGRRAMLLGAALSLFGFAAWHLWGGEGSSNPVDVPVALVEPPAVSPEPAMPEATVNPWTAQPDPVSVTRACLDRISMIPLHLAGAKRSEASCQIGTEVRAAAFYPRVAGVSENLIMEVAAARALVPLQITADEVRVSTGPAPLPGARDSAGTGKPPALLGAGVRLTQNAMEAIPGITSRTELIIEWDGSLIVPDAALAVLSLGGFVVNSVQVNGINKVRVTGENYEQ